MQPFQVLVANKGDQQCTTVYGSEVPHTLQQEVVLDSRDVREGKSLVSDPSKVCDSRFMESRNEEHSSKTSEDEACTNQGRWAIQEVGCLKYTVHIGQYNEVPEEAIAPCGSHGLLNHLAAPTIHLYWGSQSKFLLTPPSCGKEPHLMRILPATAG